MQYAFSGMIHSFEYFEPHDGLRIALSLNRRDSLYTAILLETIGIQCNAALLCASLYKKNTRVRDLFTT